MWLAIVLGVIVVALGVWSALRANPARPIQNEPDFPNDSGQHHHDNPIQTWAEFLNETRHNRNSGQIVKLGDARSGHEIGIVGESFYLTELHWVRATFGGFGEPTRVSFPAYLIAEPENPHSKNSNAVRVESPRGHTIGHLSTADADAYASVFKTLHQSGRVGTCRAVAVGGTQYKPNVGVWITIGHAAWLTELLLQHQQPPKRRRRRAVQPVAPAEDQPF